MEGETGKTFIDLGKHRVKTQTRTDIAIKVVEVRSRADLKPVTDMVYRGNILVLDFAFFEDDIQEKRTFAKSLMKTATDLNSHFAEVSETLMVVTGNGMPIERVRIKHGA